MLAITNQLLNLVQYVIQRKILVLSKIIKGYLAVDSMNQFDLELGFRGRYTL